MLTLSKPISASQAQAYHKSEFANAKENYYTEGERVRGEWQGQLAERYGLKGEVNEEQFARLSEGQHPQTGEALIRRQQAHEYINEKGETVAGGAGPGIRKLGAPGPDFRTWDTLRCDKRQASGWIKKVLKSSSRADHSFNNLFDQQDFYYL